MPHSCRRKRPNASFSLITLASPVVDSAAQHTTRGGALLRSERDLEAGTFGV